MDLSTRLTRNKPHKHCSLLPEASCWGPFFKLNFKRSKLVHCSSLLALMWRKDRLLLHNQSSCPSYSVDGKKVISSWRRGDHEIWPCSMTESIYPKVESVLEKRRKRMCLKNMNHFRNTKTALLISNLFMEELFIFLVTKGKNAQPNYDWYRPLNVPITYKWPA